MIMIMADMSSELSLIMKMMIDKRYPQPGRQGQGFLCAPPTHVAPRLSRGYKTNDDNDDLRWLCCYYGGMIIFIMVL